MTPKTKRRTADIKEDEVTIAFHPTLEPRFLKIIPSLKDF